MAIVPILAELLDAVDHPPPRDPKRYADLINDLCRCMCVFRDSYDGCPQCGDGDLETWTDGSECFWVCTMFGDCFDSENKLIERPPGLRPATRSELRALSAKAASLLAFG